jgi:hypothetical protein
MIVELQGCIIVALQSCVIVGLQGCMIVELQGCIIVALQALQALQALHDCYIARLRFKVALLLRLPIIILPIKIL